MMCRVWRRRLALLKRLESVAAALEEGAEAAAGGLAAREAAKADAGELREQAESLPVRFQFPPRFFTFDEGVGESCRQQAARLWKASYGLKTVAHNNGPGSNLHASTWLCGCR